MVHRLGLAVLIVAASWFYVTAAGEHARRINVSKARGDQSGYLWDAENVFHNWHGRTPKMLIGQRNRMPLYAGYLALFYHSGLTDPDYFEVAKRANIHLSLGLLVLLGALWWRTLPVLPAFNLTGIVAFGIFIYKAGYSQSELLFCFFMFLTFLGCWSLLRSTAPERGRLLGLAAATAAAAALAHLTKAAMPPYLALFLTVFVAKAIADSRVKGRTIVWARLAWRGAALGVFALVFLVLLSPYLATNKRVFGRYFYNVNSTFYVWYDDWPSASVGTALHGDGQHWPDLPEQDLPSAARYWREHTARAITARIVAGAENMAVVSYRTYDYLPFLILYGAAAAWLIVRRRAEVRAMLSEEPWLAGFFAAYAAVYLLAIAFYYPISGTGTARFLIPHLVPLFFALSRLTASPRFGGLQRFHAGIAILLIADVLFRTESRLLATYGGF